MNAKQRRQSRRAKPAAGTRVRVKRWGVSFDGVVSEWQGGAQPHEIRVDCRDSAGIYGRYVSMAAIKVLP
jgi:hypothetical protein